MIKIFKSVLALLMIVTVSQAQIIPNGDFTNWSLTNGYNDPVGWGTLNEMTSPENIYTVTEGSASGDPFIKLISQNVPNMGVMPGLAVSGMLDMFSFQPMSGFVYTSRPLSLTGKYQYMASSANDVGFIKAYLTKWNSSMNMRDTIGFVSTDLNGMAMSWANFTLLFTYNSNEVPDSCVIILSSSGNSPEAGSYLNVDNLAFSGGTTSIKEDLGNGTFSLYPNPSQDYVNIDFSGLKSAPLSITLTDMNGKTITSIKANGGSTQTVSIDNLPAGNYLLNVNTASGSVNKKITKR